MLFRLIFGVFFGLFGLGIGIFVFVMGNREIGMIDAQPPLESASAVQNGQRVLLEGPLTEDTPVLEHGLVLACEEEYRRFDDDHDWVTTRQLNQPVSVRIGDGSVKVQLEQPCPRGNYTVWKDPADDEHRFVGMERGATITVLGKVTSTNPPTVAGDLHFAGSVAEYRSMVSGALWLGPLFGAVFAAIGFGLAVSALLRRR